LARFVYRLESVYKLRERRVKEQEQAVLEAQQAVRNAEVAVEKHDAAVLQLRAEMQQADPMMYSTYDRYLHKMTLDRKQLVLNVRSAEEALEAAKQELQRVRQEMEALEKHKEQAKELWREEEKAIEMKQLDEVASQRYFRDQQSAAEEALLEGEV
jgi:flagellar export protein FliJ